MSFELSPFPDAPALASEVARRWLDDLAARVAADPYCVTLSGGRIARQFFEAVAERATAKPELLANVHFFWADERCVPPDHADSNFRVADETLFRPLAIPAAHIHRIRGEMDPTFAAAEAEAELCRIAELDANGQPILDQVFLGMGEDGHVASLFPGESLQAQNDPVVYRAVIAPKPPPNRITLNYSAIAVARNVWVLVSGAGKEQALKESLRSDASTPCGKVVQSRNHTRIFTDVAYA